MNDRVIDTSLGAQNKVGRVIGVVGDGGKRKFTIALDSGGEVVLAREALKPNLVMRLRKCFLIQGLHHKLQIQLQ